MTQTEIFVTALKQLLKQNGRTYKDVAKALDLSEASIKRKFADNNFTLSGLENILKSIDLDLEDLFGVARKSQFKDTQLTLEQEIQIASDPKLLLITVLALSHWSLEEIISHYSMPKSDCISYLITLDKLKLIELRTNNQIKLLIPIDFTWRVGGPIQNFFLKNIAVELLSTKFDDKRNALVCLNGMMTAAGMEAMEQGRKRLASQFRELCLDAADLPLEKKNGTTLVVAMRDWNFSIFEPYRNSPGDS